MMFETYVKYSQRGVHETLGRGLRSLGEKALEKNRDCSVISMKVTEDPGNKGELAEDLGETGKP